MPKHQIFAAVITTACCLVSPYASAEKFCGWPEAGNDLLSYDYQDKNLLTNDVATSGCPLTARLSVEPMHGKVVIQANGSFTYTPNSGYEGDDLFRYNADNRDGRTDRAVVRISVGTPQPVTNPPTNDTNPDLTGSKGGVPPSCIVGGCPEPALTYSPSYPPLGQYSVPQMCEAIHSESAPTVTLFDGETLHSAAQRLAVISPTGGVLAVPYNADTVQCDSLKLNKKLHFSGGLTLKGLPGPNGEQPRFYCRSDDERYGLGGTIPADQVATAFLIAAQLHHTLLIENIHVDGYKSALKLGTKGTHVVRNSWFHHGPHNGISSGNTGGPGKDPYRGIEDTNRFSLQACGLEVSHYGQGNHTHNFYMHRGLGGGGENPYWLAEGSYNSWSEVTLIDSLVHSPGWASAYKSIANKNNIHNNRFYSTLKTDPSFSMKGKHAQMLIDVPSCSQNTITGNELHNFKPSANAGGSAIVGLRGRRTAMRGCDIPLVWLPYATKDVRVPTAKNPNAAIHTAQWWTAQEDTIWFPTIFENNLVTVSGKYAMRQTAIEIYGTYWIYEGPKKVGCFLETPETWYERSRLYANKNTYVGFKDREHIYATVARKHNKNCLNQPQPKGPGPSSDLYQAGPLEVYQYPSAPKEGNQESNDERASGSQTGTTTSYGGNTGNGDTSNGAQWVI